MNADRIAGAVIILFSGTMAYLSLQLDSGLMAGSVDVSGTPLTIAAIGGVLGIALILFPDKDFKPVWPKPASWIYPFGIIILMPVYALMLEWTGFILSSTLFMIGVFLIFGVSIVRAIILALVSTVLIFLLFNTVLDVSLPIGNLIRD